MDMPSKVQAIQRVATARCLVKRHLTVDHSGFQASCHNIKNSVHSRRKRTPSPLRNATGENLVTEIIAVYSVNHKCIHWKKCNLKHVKYIVITVN
jgi:hypothetical protein